MTCSILLMNINRFKQKLHTWLKMTNFHNIQNIPAKQEQVDKKKNFQEMLCGTGESRIMFRQVKNRFCLLYQVGVIPVSMLNECCFIFIKHCFIVTVSALLHCFFVARICSCLTEGACVGPNGPKLTLNFKIILTGIKKLFKNHRL